MFLNRKGIAAEIPRFFIASIFLVVIFFAVATATGKAQDLRADVTPLTYEVYLSRLLFSSDCLAYTDVRSHPGVIDLSLFDSLQLSSCLQRDYFGARLVLRYTDQERIAYLHKDAYDLLSPLCFDAHYSCASFYQYVLVHDGEQILPGHLFVDFAFKGLKR